MIRMFRSAIDIYREGGIVEKLVVVFGLIVAPLILATMNSLASAIWWYFCASIGYSMGGSR